MRESRRTTLRAVAFGLVLCLFGAARANTVNPGKNPYDQIVQKNVFRLKPTPVPTPVEPPKAPLPKITLTGIATFGKKQAMLKTPPPPVRPGEQPKGEQFFTLGVGERDGDLEMLEINELTGAVRVRYAGTELALNFVDNGATPATAPALPPGGQQPQPGGYVPSPIGTPNTQPTLPARPVPTRTLRLPTPTGRPTGYNPATPSNTSAAAGYVPPANNAQAIAPGAAAAYSPVPVQSPSVQQQDTLSAEEQAVLLEAQRQLNPGMPLPPTPLTTPAQTTPSGATQYQYQNQYQRVPRPY